MKTPEFGVHYQRMDDLEKRVSGDWIDVRESATDFYTLNDHFDISPAQMTAERQSLVLANEEGMVEYKRTILSPVFATLENMAYQALTHEDLSVQAATLHRVLFITMIQRAVALGAIQLVRQQNQEQGPREDSIKVILSDVQDRIKKDPDLQKHPGVKNILLSVKRYQNEMAKMKELAPTIRGDKNRATFADNFRNTFVSIEESVRKNYSEIVQEERSEEEKLTMNLARRLPLKPLGPVLTEQARHFSRMKSTLLFASGEKFKTREMLVGLFQRREEILALLDRELTVYGDLCAEELGGDGSTLALRFSKDLRDEIAALLDRQARVEEK